MKEKTISAKKAGFFRDVFNIAKRAIRSVLREPEFLIPGIIIPLFFFVVNLGSGSNAATAFGIADYKAFQLPVSIIFAVTGVSRASALVLDIQNGYFDRLLVSPVNRLSLLLGLTIADLFAVLLLMIPVLILGFILGVRFESGIVGIGIFLILGSLWGLAFTGFPYAIALKTGSPSAVNSSFVLFFPFTFLTTTFLPKEALTGWLATVSSYNPVTYILEGLRSLITKGFDFSDLLGAVLAIAGVGTLSFSLALLALKSRVIRK